RGAKLFARVEKNGKVQRVIESQKTARAILSDKKTSWLPTKPKLTLTVPYISSNEELVIVTSYDWMDIRWMRPLFMSDEVKTASSTLSVHVPLGVGMRFQAAKDGHK